MANVCADIDKHRLIGCVHQLLEKEQVLLFVGAIEKDAPIQEAAEVTPYLNPKKSTSKSVDATTLGSQYLRTMRWRIPNRIHSCRAIDLISHSTIHSQTRASPDNESSRFANANGSRYPPIVKMLLGE
jgi:hypothetical protein